MTSPSADGAPGAGPSADGLDMAGTHHVTSVHTYAVIFAILIALTFLTIVTALMPLDRGHTVIALTIAFAKAALVFLFFMHLLYSPKLVWLVAGGTFVWLAILFAFTLADYWTRATVDPFR